MNNWIKMIIGAVAVYTVLWTVFIYGYANISLVDTIVPVKGIMIEEWISSFYKAGLCSVIFAFLCNLIWNWMGNNYAGESGIQLKHNLLWVVTFVISLIASIFLIAPSQAGSGLAMYAVILVGPLGYYITTLFFSANAVKYIPPLAIKIRG